MLQRRTSCVLEDPVPVSACPALWVRTHTETQKFKPWTDTKNLNIMSNGMDVLRNRAVQIGAVCACVFKLTCSVVLVQRISLSAERQTHPAAESSLLPSHLLSLQTSRSGYAHTHTQFYVNTHFSWCAILSLCPWKWLTINCYQPTDS